MKVYLATITASSFMDGNTMEIAGVCLTKEKAWEILKKQRHFEDATNINKRGQRLDYYFYHFDGELSYFNVREVETDTDLTNEEEKND